jgi:transcriptional regulator with XRE-family HTH domain
MPRPSANERRKRLRKLLAAARKKAGLKQVEVASRMGKPQPFISRFETGERQLEVSEFLELADILGVDPCDVIRSLKA